MDDQPKVPHLWRVTLRAPHPWRRGLVPHSEVVAVLARSEDEARAVVERELPGATVERVEPFGAIVRLGRP